MASTLAYGTRRSRLVNAEWWRVIVADIDLARVGIKDAAKSYGLPVRYSSLTSLAAPVRFLDPPLMTRSRARKRTSAGSTMTLDASLTVTRPCSTDGRIVGAAGLS